MKVLWFVCVVWCAVSCETRQAAPVKDFDFSEKMSPPAVWSPRQRAVVASYSYLLGEYLTLHGRRGGETFFQRSYDLEPNAFLGRKLVMARARVEPTVEVLAIARKMTLLYPRDADLRIVYARLLAVVQDWEEAVTQAKEAVKLHAGMSSRALLIEIYVRQKEYKSALQVARQLVRAYPKEKMGWLVLARLYFLIDSPRRALAATEQGLKHHSGSLRLLIMKAWSLEKTKKSTKAAKLFENLFREHADDDLVPTLLSIYKEVGSLEDALDVLTRLSHKFKGRYPEVDLQRVFVLWELKRYTDAADVLKEILARKNHGSRLLYLAALGHEKIGEFQKAIQLFRQIEKGSRFYAHGLYRAALLYRQQKKYAEALANLRLLNTSTSSHWQGFGLMASIYAEQDRLEAALDIVEKGLQRFPKNTALLFQKGVWEEQSGDIDACVETMELIIAIDPSYAPALNYVGYLYAEMGENLEQAESYIRRALAVRPMDGYYLDSLGWVFYQRGQYEDAEKLFRKALEAEPQEGVIMEHLADTLYMMKKFDQAKKWYQLSLKGSLDERSRERIQEKLEDRFE